LLPLLLWTRDEVAKSSPVGSSISGPTISKKPAVSEFTPAKDKPSEKHHDKTVQDNPVAVPEPVKKPSLDPPAKSILGDPPLGKPAVYSIMITRGVGGLTPVKEK
jgi:hypothetical protein